MKNDLEKRDYWILIFGKTKDDILSDHWAATDNGCHSLLREAYDKVHDVRKYEIELYWKRAIYFWGFEAAFLVVFGSLLTSNYFAEKSIILLLLCFLSFLFTFLWCLALQGMKRWQENWELHLDYLEDAFSGSLYKTVLYKNNDQFSFYSVSRINETMAMFLALTWLLSFFWFLYEIGGEDSWGNIIWAILFLAGVLAVIVYRKKTNFDGHEEFTLTDSINCHYRGEHLSVEDDSTNTTDNN